ncbi:signal peptide peptidase SppA [Shewanella sp. D64]|uniref:signal peptide peptidase SppA n=1 Tax=unclassified Shewanella TaxID=196818 RepID=UPI0022BA31C1|nr:MULTISPECIES: signal peptide peptidase SppA [unclassified Shewanella]MEC4724110.1 signal peptide peptidase SppA [Shewanella sp. D64]MEC4736130.1 signal peptide peptidase SppA [Shewanella sp. E94]WBJ97928.1 signal peptide peptidase SppA [Shewanella sp. MTB7]
MSAKPSLIKKLFVLLWKTINGTRKLILNVIFFGLLIAIIVAMNIDESVNIETGSALVLNLSGSIVEQQKQVDPIKAAMQSTKDHNVDGEILLADVLNVIDNAAHDTRISSIVLNTGHLQSTGISKLQSIGDALTRFKESGKPVIAISNWYGQNQYFLASYADTIYLNPQGGVEMEGLSRYRQYYKSALDKLKIKAHIFRVGTFKSAVEPYIRDDMSPAAKEANLALLTDIWGSYQEVVSLNREIADEDLVLSAERYMAELDKAEGKSAQMALNMNWVDELATAETFRLKMLDLVGEASENAQFRQIGFHDYLSLTALHPQLLTNDTVGIVIAKGTILNGNQPAGSIGGESTSELLRKARFDDNVKAVVLRVDSPGGSAFASEQIRQEVLALKTAGKPVVVSMGSYAASGGYWISASADYIYATPTTLTGSIGIFGMVTTFEDSLSSIGVHTDGVATSQWAGVSVTKGLTPEIKDVIQRHIERGYRDFISLVATEREMSFDDVDNIAQGRVWSGKKAVTLGLVDELGDLKQAVAKAAEMAQLDDFDSEIIEQELTPQELFIQEMLASAAMYLPQSASHSSVLEQLFSQWSSAIDEFRSFDDPNGMYLYCDSCSF